MVTKRIGIKPHSLTGGISVADFKQPKQQSTFAGFDYKEKPALIFKGDYE
jgi:hypothetical protein